MAKNFKLSKDGKSVIVDFKNITDAEREIVQMYVNAGKLIKEKGKGGNRLTKADIEKALKDDEKNLAIYKKMVANKENFMNIKKWFNEIKK